MENTEEVKNSTDSSVKFVLSNEMVKPLKCSFCNLYLSYSPIFMTTQDDVKYKCGRCSVKTRFNFRDLMYEELAKHMKFPCIYKDCPEAVAWDDVRDHEKDCKHRTLTCFVSDCREAVLEKNFGSHFKEKHKKLYHSDKIVLDGLHSSGGICVLEKDGQGYIFLYDTNLDKYRMCLCCIQNVDKQFEITFKSKDTKNSIHLTEHNIIRYNDRVHCYRCLKGDCKLDYHMYCNYRKGMLKYANGKIDKDILKRTFSNDLSCVITVVDEKTEAENEDELDDLLMGKDVVIDEVTEEDEAEEEKQPEPAKTDAIKDLLKCPTCQQQLSQPIFQCLEGHPVCKECKEKSEESKCSTCESKIENTRNYTIEEVITNLKLSDNPKVPEDKDITCPMSKCHETIKVSGISNHFKESHLENFHFNKVILKNIYGYYNVDVLVKNGKTYLLFFDFDDFNFGISVCAIDHDDELFEVKLLSENKKSALIASDQKVIKFNDKEHCFKCSLGTCKISDHTYRVKRKEIFRRLTTRLNRDCIRRAFKSSNLSYHITIKEAKENKVDKIVRQLFECPICKYYMVPPIHQCVAGHTLCNVCKSKVEKCPSCENTIENTRNFILETISEVVEVPCSFESKSCTFRAGVKRVATHELECPLNNKKPCLNKENAKSNDTSNSVEVEATNSVKTTNSVEANKSEEATNSVDSSESTNSKEPEVEPMETEERTNDVESAANSN